MKTLLSIVTVGSLLIGTVLLPPIGAALLAAVFFAFFLLGLTGLIGHASSRVVTQHDPSMNATGWRTD
jgi:hypothetical protein